ncbi:MAG: VOC family protein [Pseudonocardia sp.]|nr:VOC family protein [Pseudonocardia sp.]
MHETQTATATATAVPPIPALTGLHHVGITVTNLERSVQWYGEMLGLVQVMEEVYPGGRVVVMVRPGTAVDIGLDSHDRNEGEPFAPHRTGLDHLALGTTTRAELDAWHAYLNAKGVECGEIKDITEPLAFSLFSFTDPDGVAIEIFYMDPGANAS